MKVSNCYIQYVHCLVCLIFFLHNNPHQNIAVSVGEIPSIPSMTADIIVLMIFAHFTKTISSKEFGCDSFADDWLLAEVIWAWKIAGAVVVGSQLF